MMVAQRAVRVEGVMPHVEDSAVDSQAVIPTDALDGLLVQIADLSVCRQ